MSDESGGCLKAAGIGCLVVVAVAAIAAVFVVRGCTNMLAEQVAIYTQPEPVPLPEPQLDEGELRALEARVRAFAEAVREGTPTEPLSLEGDELNVLLRLDEDVKKTAESFYLTVENDQLRGLVSFPLEGISTALSGNPITRGLGEAMEGRYLNGSGSVSLSFVRGRLFVFLESLEVGGDPVPGEIMDALGQENLAEEALENPDLREVLSKIETIKVEDSRVLVIPEIQSGG